MTRLIGMAKPMDVVLAVDGSRVDGPRDLQRIIALTPVGKTVTITVLREGREAALPVIVGLYKEREERSR